MESETKNETPQQVALLHTGAIFGGERDEYEIEVDSHECLERFCDQHPGQTIPLFAHPPAPVDAEPVAWFDEDFDSAYTASDLAGGHVDGLVPLFTHPPRREWVGLTEEEKRAFAFGWWKAMEKRNAEQEAEPVHEPPFVFRRYVSGEERAQNIVIERAASLDAAMAKAALICPQRWMTVLVYSPPRREWQGLTDEEQAQVAWSVSSITADWKEFYRAVEAALKEKNHD